MKAEESVGSMVRVCVCVCVCERERDLLREGRLTLEGTTLLVPS